MRRIMVGFAILLAISSLVPAGAQTLKYEKAKVDSYFAAEAEGEKFYFTNTVDASVPLGCSDSRVDVKKITQVLFQGFLDLDCALSTPKEVKDYLGRNALDRFFEYDWKQCSSIPQDADHDRSYYSDVTVTPKCVYNGVVFYECIRYDYLGGPHGSAYVKYVAVNIKEARQVSANQFFTPQRQKEIIKMLANAENIRKYSVDASYYDDEEYSEMLEGMKNYADSYPFAFPEFYIEGGNLFLQFQSYQLGYYALGQPIFRIPLSVAK